MDAVVYGLITAGFGPGDISGGDQADPTGYRGAAVWVDDDMGRGAGLYTCSEVQEGWARDLASGIYLYLKISIWIGRSDGISNEVRVDLI